MSSGSAPSAEPDDIDARLSLFAGEHQERARRDSCHSFGLFGFLRDLGLEGDERVEVVGEDSLPQRRRDGAELLPGADEGLRAVSEQRQEPLRLLRGARVRMRGAHEESAQAVRCVASHVEPDAASHRMPVEGGPFDAQLVEHRDHVGDRRGGGVGVGIVRLVAPPMATRIDEDQGAIALETVDVAVFVPALDAVAEPVLQHEWRPDADDPVVDSGSVVDRVPYGLLGHGRGGHQSATTSPAKRS